MLEMAADFREHYQPYDAELIGNVPQWHVVITAPNHERIAAAHLVARRFAVYAPEIDKAIPASRGRPARIEKRPLFPGYLFVLVWDISAHMHRIRGVPGVVNMLYCGEEPAIIADEIIDFIQIVEFKGVKLHKSKRQRWRKHKLIETDEVMELVSIAPYDAWNEWRSIETLDDTGRNSLLRRALGLVE